MRLASRSVPYVLSLWGGIALGTAATTALAFYLLGDLGPGVTAILMTYGAGLWASQPSSSSARWPARSVRVLRDARRASQVGRVREALHERVTPSASGYSRSIECPPRRAPRNGPGRADLQGERRGTDVDAQGKGTVSDQRLYQLVRQPKGVEDREFRIEFVSRAFRCSPLRSAEAERRTT